MIERLILYRNELKNKNIYKYKLIGILVELLYSRELFPKNRNIGDFLLEIFGIQYKEYVMRSRGLIISRICKLFVEENKNKEYAKQILSFVNSKILELSKSRQNNKDALKGWIK